MGKRRREGLSRSKGHQSASTVQGIPTTRLLPKSYTAEVLERCCCLPCSPLHPPSQKDRESFVPISAVVQNQLRTVLDELIPHSTPLSILLLHVSQVEQAQVISGDIIVPPRYRYHIKQELLEQVLDHVRRVVRANDQMLVLDNSGAVLILPHVDEAGAYSILARVSHSLGLLQAETMVPPLTRETTILIGSGTCPRSRASADGLLYCLGHVARCFTFRPAITTHLWDSMPRQEIVPARGSLGVPFLDLPSELSIHLKQLLPYQLAEELRCVPVGRDQQYLTVAMADPQNAENVRRLREVTGMTIFPVACKEEDLDALLLKVW